MKSETDVDNWWEENFKPHFSVNQCFAILDLKENDSESDQCCVLSSTELPREEKAIGIRTSKPKVVVLRDVVARNISDISSGGDCDKGCQTKESIWDRKELRILRECLLKLNRENRKLSAQVRSLAVEKEEGAARMAELRGVLQEQQDKLSAATKTELCLVETEAALEAAEVRAKAAEEQQQREKVQNRQRQQRERQQKQQEREMAQETQQRRQSEREEMRALADAAETAEAQWRSMRTLDKAENQREWRERNSETEKTLQRSRSALTAEVKAHAGTKVALRQMMLHFGESRHRAAADTAQSSPMGNVNLKTVQY